MIDVSLDYLPSYRALLRKMSDSQLVFVLSRESDSPRGKALFAEAERRQTDSEGSPQTGREADG